MNSPRLQSVVREEESWFFLFFWFFRIFIEWKYRERRGHLTMPGRVPLLLAIFIFKLHLIVIVVMWKAFDVYLGFRCYYSFRSILVVVVF